MNLEETVVPIQIVNKLVMILHASVRIVTVRHKTILMDIYKGYRPILNKKDDYLYTKGRKTYGSKIKRRIHIPRMAYQY